MRKWTIIVILVIVAIVFYNYLYKDHRNIASEEVFAALDSTKFIKEFKDNSEDSNTKYLNQTVKLSGTISQSSNNAIILDEKVYCQLESASKKENLTIGDGVDIKGRVIGYDDMLEEIKLDQCIILNK